MKKPFKWLFAFVLSLVLLVPSIGAATAATGQGASEGTVSLDKNTKAANSTKASSFSDVSKNFWAKNEINYLVRNGIISGYKNGKFGVNDPLRRDHAAIILVRALDINLSKESAPNPGFKDVPTTHPAYKEIAVLTKYGVFSKSQYFHPTGKLTRGQMAKILTEGFGFRYSYLVTFKDVPSTNQFYSYICTLGSAGIAGGTNGNFLPNKTLNRTEFSVFIARALKPSFRTGVQVEIQSLQYQSDGRLKMSLIMYNNSPKTVFNIKGRYTLYSDNTAIARNDSAREYTNLKIGAHQKKVIDFYFAPSEVKNKVPFKNTNLAYEHSWNFYQ
ncbi:S-layer homology domain-containing protein [Bacillus badius]|uniref:S-layer homology domain-containing protein n=1 Tax=Bacillus badius TaxID=1455 RepID=UPI002E1BD626|nr:S-layer homology domain-containing protein [Bacillus badius]